MRYDLKKREGQNCIFIALAGSRNPEGRQFFKDVMIIENNNVNIIGKCDHVNTSVKNIKGKLKKGDVVRFTGRVCKYQRADGSVDYSVTPSKNCRKATQEEFDKYKGFIKHKNKRAFA